MKMLGIFTKYRMHGFNSVRVMLLMDTVAGEAEIKNHPLTAIDKMVEAAEYSGIRLIINTFVFGSYIFRQPTQARQVFDFVTSRWGSSPAILMWDIINDYEEVVGMTNPEQFISEMVN